MINREAHNGVFQEECVAFQEVVAGSGDLGTARDINDIELFSQCYVIFWLEIELRRRSNFVEFYIFTVVLALWCFARWYGRNE